MSLNFQTSIANDHLVFDGVQTITLTKTDDSGTDAVAGVSSFTLNKKQAALLAGMGIEDEARGFSLPTVNVAAGYEPVNGMEFADAAGQQWRMVTVEMKTMGSRFLVMAVKTRVAFIHVFEPSLVVPGAQSLAVDATLDLSELVSIEFDGDAETELTFTVSHVNPAGILTLGMTDLSITGTLAEIQAVIDEEFSYVAPDSAGSDTITLTIRRAGEESAADTETIAITITGAP